jgi:putative aldouronate transport system substrate-binding protein
MKKLSALLLTLLLLSVTVISGCSGSGNTPATTTVTEQPGSQDTSTETPVEAPIETPAETPMETATAAAEKIIVTFVYATVEPTDLKKVETAVNEITVPNINVEVEFKPISLADSFTNYSLWISSGEQVDLMDLLAQSVNQYVSTGQLEPLDQYVTAEKTPTTWNLIQEFGVASYVNGEMYGLSSVFPNYGWQPGMILRKEWL